MLDVEHGEAFEERNAGQFVATIASAGLLALGNEAVGVADGGAALALADMPTKAKRLTERQPLLRAETAPNDGIPQDEDIDPRIMPRVDGVFRQAKAALAPSQG